ncbi:peptidoglycan endopeptidase [Sphingomonas sp.]|uniref:peptidoglycan endopeptidase n=1 Tax=Sphingomonas sp. TaxID=28214 RepID=UPI0035A84933
MAAARAAIGVRFRLHGRDPATGLDCVGLAAIALGEEVVPSGYAMRGGDPARIAAMIDARALVRADDAQPGDLLLCASGPGQLHLAIDSGAGVIHADAMLRRVVERPGPVPWPVLGRWRQRGEDSWQHCC